MHVRLLASVVAFRSSEQTFRVVASSCVQVLSSYSGCYCDGAFCSMFKPSLSQLPYNYKNPLSISEVIDRRGK